MQVKMFSHARAVTLGSLGDGDAFMQVPDAGSFESVKNTAYIVLRDSPSKKREEGDDREVMVAILSSGQVLRWPGKTKVLPVSLKVVPA